MALKNVKPSAAGSSHKARYNTREEVKTAGKKIRRAADKHASKEEV